MSRIEPGMMAITINCARPENNGLVVDVLGFAGVGNVRQPNGNVIGHDERAWWVRVKNGTLTTKTLVSDTIIQQSVGSIEEYKLHPIRPHAQDDSVCEGKGLEVVA